MRTQAVPEAIITHSHRFVSWICYLLIFAFALRRVIEMDEGYSVSLALALTAVFTGLYASQPLLSNRFAGYSRFYFSLQIILALVLSLFQEYLDTVALLYIVLGFQAIVICPRKEALVWMSLFTGVIFLTLVIEFGLLSGLGRAMAYTVIGAFFISYDIQYSQHEDALAESQLLLTELQEAHRKLEEYASQLERLAAAQEHERIIQELYDAVGQKIFAIQLAAEATRIKFQKDSQSIDLLDQLQQQTQDVLSQMRQLISQWRPG
jgi:signal transduction histidine kinase